MAKTKISKAAAIQLAKDAGLKVSESVAITGSDARGRATRYVRIAVGDQLVEYRSEWGGCGCYRTSDRGGFYVGQAIEHAVKKQTADFSVHREGSIVLFWAKTARAVAWWAENVEDSAPDFAGAHVVEHRYAWNIYVGIKEAGLTAGDYR